MPITHGSPEVAPRVSVSASFPHEGRFRKPRERSTCLLQRGLFHRFKGPADV
jgi:hypothetical protein